MTTFVLLTNWLNAQFDDFQGTIERGSIFLGALIVLIVFAVKRTWLSFVGTFVLSGLLIYAVHNIDFGADKIDDQFTKTLPAVTETFAETSWGELQL